MNGDNSGDNDNAVGGDVDVSPNWAVVSSPYNIDQLPEPASTRSTHRHTMSGT